MKMESMTEEKMVLMAKYILKDGQNSQKISNKAIKIRDLQTEKKFTMELFEKLFDKMMVPIVHESGQTEYAIEFIVKNIFLMHFLNKCLENSPIHFEFLFRKLQVQNKN